MTGNAYHRFFVLLTVVLPLVAPSVAAAPPKLPMVEPEAVGMDGGKLREIDREVAAAIAEKKMPGCVVGVGRRGKLVLLKAYGDKQVRPSPVPMTTDTVFDLASLTKPIATATSVMILVERGRIDLDAPVARYLPEFAQNGKEAITVRQLLTHQGGLIADNHLRDYRDGAELAWERIFALRPIAAPGAKLIYTDVGFLVLGRLVERVSGMTLRDFSRQNLFAPLGMSETGYLPESSLQSR
ncbi:MAG TPA: hypothetical protein DD670_08205, partial [Planctomycetaceae bacterium]|nr:hypothetical protein [Planctomycetaceae bacterium]